MPIIKNLFVFSVIYIFLVPKEPNIASPSYRIAPL